MCEGNLEFCHVTDQTNYIRIKSTSLSVSMAALNLYIFLAFFASILAVLRIKSRLDC